jgi:hypothetical protein
MVVVGSLFSFVNSALTNVQKKAGQFKKCRVRLVGPVNVMIRISAGMHA